MNASPLRDQRIGRLLRARAGTRPLRQAELGGTHEDNVMRMADWRNRYARVPVEATTQPVPYRPIPRYLALTVIEENSNGRV